MITQKVVEINKKKFYYSESDKYLIHKKGEDVLYSVAYDVKYTEYLESEVLKQDDNERE